MRRFWSAFLVFLALTVAAPAASLVNTQPSLVGNDGQGFTPYSFAGAVQNNFVALNNQLSAKDTKRIATNYYNFDQGTGVAGVAPTASIAYFTPVRMNASGSITRLTIAFPTVTTAGNCQLALYPWNAPNPTGSPLAYTGSIATAVGTPVSGSFVGGSGVSGGALALAEGPYWLAVDCDAATYTYQALSPLSPTASSRIGSTLAAAATSASMVQGRSTSMTFGTWSDVTSATWADIRTALAPLGGYYASVSTITDQAAPVSAAPIFLNNNTWTGIQTFVGGQRTGTALGLTAAGTTLATALALTADVNEVTTVASGSGVVIAPYNATLGGVQRQEIVNAGANALNVWPPAAGAAIRVLNGSTSAAAAGAAVTLAVGTHATMECVSTTLCYEAP